MCIFFLCLLFSSLLVKQFDTATFVVNGQLHKLLGIDMKFGVDVIIFHIMPMFKSFTLSFSTFAAICVLVINLATAYSDGANIRARENMLEASYHAGIAFRQAYVGYIHAIAHNFGGMYGTPHGLANAVIMPYVLDWYGESAHKRLAELADVAGIVTTEKTDAEKANLLIRKIREMNRDMNIPEHLEVQEKDVATIAERAMFEGNPLYPVPKIMNKQQCIALIRKIGGLDA